MILLCMNSYFALRILYFLFFWAWLRLFSNSGIGYLALP